MSGLILSFLILFLGNTFFPEYIQAENVQTIILVSIAITVMIRISYFLIALLIVVFPTATVALLGILTALVLVPASLILASMYFPGFMIKGVLTYVVLTLLMCCTKVNFTMGLE